MDMPSTTPAVGQLSPRRQALLLAAAVAASLAVHSLLVLEGFGEQDSARTAGRVLAWREQGVIYPVDYQPRVSPLYLMTLKTALDAGLAAPELPAFMNWLSVIAGSLALVPMYLIGRKLLNPTGGFCLVLLMSFSTAFFRAQNYGMPHVLGMAFFLASAAAFLYALDRTGWRFWALQAGAAAAMFLGCANKADQVLSAGALLGLAVARRRLNARTAACAVTVPLLAVAGTVLLSGFLPVPARRSPGEFTESWSQRFPIDVVYGLTGGQVGTVFSLGPALAVAVVAAVVYGLISRRCRQVVLLGLIWAVPPIIFWSTRPGNSARHSMLANVGLLLILTAALLNLLPRRRLALAAAVGLVAINYFSYPRGPEKVITARNIRPTPRVIEGAIDLQSQVTSMHDRSREVLEIDSPKILLVVEWERPYAVYEILTHVRDFHYDTATGELTVTRHDGRTQVFRTFKGDPDEVPDSLREGWTIWHLDV